MKASRFSFRVTIETEFATGAVLAAYFQLREGKSARVREFVDGTVFADYDKQGKLIGIEMLGPCSPQVIDEITGQERTKRFVHNNAPRDLLVTA